MKRGEHKTPEQRRERREEILNWMEKVGPFSVPKRKIAEKHGVSERTIRKDVEILIKKMKFDKVENTGKKILITLNNSLSKAEEMSVSLMGKDKLGAIAAINQTAQTFTDLLEKYGFKEKVADKHELTNKIFDVQMTVVKPEEEELPHGDKETSEENSG